MKSSNIHQTSQGLIIRKAKGTCLVNTNGQTIPCAIPTRLWKESESAAHGKNPYKLRQHGEPVAVGDIVRYTEVHNGMGQIVEVLPRRNKLARRSAVPLPGAHPFEQVIAANIDLVVPVFAYTHPIPKWNMLDRYLVSAEAARIPPLICITKLDLANLDDRSVQHEVWDTLETYRKIGYAIILTSTRTGEGIVELVQALQGRISVLLGKSGVGKTSLLNAILPESDLRIKDVSQKTGKGKHATTWLEMYLLGKGGAIVDTPGEREFGLWDVDVDELAWFFPEMRPYIGKCKFGSDCHHDEEPGCAIRKAAMTGHIDPRRYQSYMRLREET
jgi:ribosome biogenesis GTPase